MSRIIDALLYTAFTMFALVLIMVLGFFLWMVLSPHPLLALTLGVIAFIIFLFCYFFLTRE